MGVVDILIEDARQEGIEQGINQGKQEGRQEAASQKEKDFATSLILSTDFDDTKIALLVGITTQYVQALRFELVK